MAIKKRRALTYKGLVKKMGGDEDRLRRYIEASDCTIDFCSIISSKTGIELTVRQAADVLATAPVKTKEG